MYVECRFLMNTPMSGSLATAFFIGYNIRETPIRSLIRWDPCFLQKVEGIKTSYGRYKE